MALWDSVVSGLGSLFGGAKDAISQGASYLGQGAQGLGSLANQGIQGLGSLGSKAMGGIGSLFGGFGGGSGGPQAPNPVGQNNGNNINQWLGSSHSPGSLGAQVPNMASSIGQTTSNAPGGGSGMLSQLFKSPMVRGLAGIGASQFIGNPKVPALPSSYNQLMSQINAGGSPTSQYANQYLQQVMSGQNMGAYDAATQSVDQEYEQQLRQLDAMYKSLRPGTDLASDASYRRDRQALDDQYMQRKAMVKAQVQQGAVGQALGAGQSQIQNQMAMLQPQFDQQAQQWAADYQKQATLRNQLMGIGASYAYPQNSGYGALSQLFGRAGNTNPIY